MDKDIGSVPLVTGGSIPIELLNKVDWDKYMGYIKYLKSDKGKLEEYLDNLKSFHTNNIALK